MTSPSSSVDSSRPAFGFLLPRILSLAVLVALAALAVLAVRWDRHPVEPLPADAPKMQFSAARALPHVKRMAAAPRPTGTAANAAVRNYLLEQLGALGLETQVQQATVTRRRQGPVRAAVVTNVLALLPGRENRKGEPAVLLMAHYDSVPWSPGAGDDASGVAAVLETARALTSGPSLARDVILLLTDGEEGGLWGAKAFVDEHAWASRVGVALNVDARGASGASLMFRTGEANLWLARALREAVPAPRATSLSYELFRLLPNDTDLAVFTAAGIPGMDFAFIGSHPRYHSALDTADRLDPRSLQHQGSYLLGLAQYLGEQELGPLPEGKGTYFNVLGSRMVIYPSSWALPLAGLGLVLWLGMVLWAVRRKSLTGGKLAAAVGGLVLAASASALLTLFAWQQLTLADGDFGWLPRGLSYEDSAYSIALIFLATAVSLGLLFLFQRGLGTAPLVCGAALLWLLGALAGAWQMPGLSYFFLWPPVFVLIGLALQWLLGSRWWWFFGALAAAPAVLICVPTAPTLLEGLGLSAATALAVLLTLFLGLLAGLFAPWSERQPWLVPALALMAAGAAAWSPLTSSPFDEDHPRATSLFYCLDGSSGQASWGSSDQEMDDWTRSYFEERVEDGDLSPCLLAGPRERYRAAPAPGPTSVQGQSSDLPSPSIELVSQELAEDGTYVVTVRLQSLRSAAMLALAVDSLAPVQEIRVNGRVVDLGDRPLAGRGEAEWVLRYQGPAGEPVEVGLLLREEHPVELRLVDQTWGLPNLGTENLRQGRPEDTIPSPRSWLSDATLVSTRVFF